MKTKNTKSISGTNETGISKQGPVQKPGFTPGPWTKTFDGKGILALSSKGTFMKIAESLEVSFLDGTGSHDVTEIEAKANAALISAAPELLLALDAMTQLLLEQSRKSHLHAGQTEVEMREINEIQGMAKRAIAKARGEQ